MLKVVLDTNVFLVSLVSHLKYYWVFETLIDGKYELAVSNEILTEYLEVVSQRYGLINTETKLDFLLFFPNVRLVTPYYHWQLIDKDNDDNKFVDCAIASNADYLVTNDKHFNVLRDIGFPKINVISVDEFKMILFRSKLN